MNKLSLSDDKARKVIEECIDRNFLVEAGAGSGKTTCLVKRMISKIMNSEARVEEIVAITFTKKAADELKQRFQNKLEKTLNNTSDIIMKDKLNKALENIDNCFIGTIHSFCSRLLRERPIEAGIDPSFQEMDDASVPQLTEEAWRSYIEEVRLNRPELLRDLDNIGIKAEELKDSFIRISNYPDVDINYKKADKPDFKPHLDKLKILISNSLHNIPVIEPDMGFDKLQENIKTAKNHISYLDMTDELNVIKVLSLFSKEPKITQNRWVDKAEAKEIKEEFTLLAEELLITMTKWREYCYYYVLQFIKPAAKYYEALRYKRSLLNFQDLLMKAAATLKNHPEVRKYFQDKYKYLLVDEYQDTDPIQAEIVFYLTGTDIHGMEWQSLVPKPGSLFVVGDPKQSIYRFRRADIDIYNLTKELIEKSGGETLSLTSNFRSLKSICELLNKTHKGIFPTEHNTHQAKYCSLEGVRENNPGTDFGVRSINISEAFTKKDDVMAQDAVSIAKYVKWAMEGNVKLDRSEEERLEGLDINPCPKDFMIILKYKDQMELYSRALESLGIPAVISGGSSFGAYPEMMEILKLLKAVGDINNEVYLVAALRGMFFGVSDDALYKFKINGGRFSIFSDIPDKLTDEIKVGFGNAYEKLREYHKLTKTLPPSAASNRIINACGVIPYTLSCEMGYNRCSSIYQLLEMINKYEIDGIQSFNEMLKNIEAIFEAKPENELSIAGDNRNAVRIMNLHKAKGLEAPIVFLANPSKLTAPRVDMHNKRTGKRPEGYLCIKKANGFQSEILAQPVNWATYEAEEEEYLRAEENRLLYVAGTRAKNLLIISSSDKSNNKNPWIRLLDKIEPGSAIDLDSITISSPKVNKLKLDNFEAEKQRIIYYDNNMFKPSFEEMVPSKIAEEKIIIKSDYEDRLGAAFGTIMHKLYEKLIKNKNVSEKDIKRMLEEYNEPQERLTIIQALLENFKACDIYQRIQNSSKILCEVPFSIKVENDDEILKNYNSINKDVPVLISGIIDLAFKEKDGWVILDYKTNALKNEEEKIALKNHYSSQINLYCKVFERIGKEKVSSGVLCFVRGIKESSKGPEIVSVF